MRKELHKGEHWRAIEKMLLKLTALREGVAKTIVDALVTFLYSST